MCEGLVAFDPYTTQEKAASLGVELVSLDELLRASDYILVNCPLTPQTRGLLGKAQFSLMKPDAVIINTARGPIVDEAALIEALQSGKIAGAALDVFEKEPFGSWTLRWPGWIMSSYLRIRLRGLRSFFATWAASIVGRCLLSPRRGAAECRQSRGFEPTALSGKACSLPGCFHSGGEQTMSGLRQRLQQGELLLGQMVLELFTPGIGPMLEACGLDFVIFDMEHGRCDIALMSEMIARVAEAIST